MTCGKSGLKKAVRVELEFLESVLARNPRDELTMRALADLYTGAGMIHEGLQMDLRLAEQYPHEPDIWYNLGCSYSLAAQVDEAILALEQAVKLGYSDVDWMEQDEDLDNIRPDPRFRAILNTVNA